MAFSRKALKAMGISDEQIESLIEMHTETIEALKAERDQLKQDVQSLEAVQTELNELKAKDDGGWEEKYNALKNEYDGYKSSQAAKETRAIKNNAVREYLKSKNIQGANLDIAMRGLSAEIDAAELDGDKIKDTKVLDDLIAGTYAGLVTETIEQGAPPPDNPISSNGGTSGWANKIAQEYYNNIYGPVNTAMPS